MTPQRHIHAILKELVGSNIPIIGVLGAGSLGKAFVNELVPDYCCHVVWFNSNRGGDRLGSGVREIMNKIAASGVRIDGEPRPRPRQRLLFDDDTIIGNEDSPSPVDGCTARVYSRDGDKNLHLVSITDPWYFSALAPFMDIIYYTIGRSEHGKDGAQVDREKSITANFEALAENVYKLGLDKAHRAFHMVTSNPDNLIVRGYQELTELPPEQVVALGARIDSARLASVISEFEHDILPSDIRTPAIFGNHGPDMILVPQLTTIDAGIFAGRDADALLGSNISLRGYCEHYTAHAPDPAKAAEELLEEFRKKTALEGQRILLGNATEGTSLGPMRVAIQTLIEVLPRRYKPGTKESVNNILGIRMPDGQYGIKTPTWLGHTAAINTNGEAEFVPTELTPDQQRQMRETAERLDALYMAENVQTILQRARATRRIAGGDRSSSVGGPSGPG